MILSLVPLGKDYWNIELLLRRTEIWQRAKAVGMPVKCRLCEYGSAAQRISCMEATVPTDQGEGASLPPISPMPLAVLAARH